MVAVSDIANQRRNSGVLLMVLPRQKRLAQQGQASIAFQLKPMVDSIRTYNHLLQNNVVYESQGCIEAIYRCHCRILQHIKMEKTS
jgi:hypothetical protein